MQILKSSHFMSVLFYAYCVEWVFSFVLLSHGSKCWGWLGFYVSRSKMSFFIHEGCEKKKKVFSDKSSSCSVVGLMKSTAQECNSIQASSIPLCLKCRQTLASSLKANYNVTSRDLQCYWYLSAFIFGMCYPHAYSYQQQTLCICKWNVNEFSHGWNLWTGLSSYFFSLNHSMFASSAIIIISRPTRSSFLLL